MNLLLYCVKNFTNWKKNWSYNLVRQTPLSSFVSLFFWDEGSHSPGWPPACCVAQDNPLIFPPTSTSWVLRLKVSRASLTLCGAGGQARDFLRARHFWIPTEHHCPLPVWRCASSVLTGFQWGGSKGCSFLRVRKAPQYLHRAGGLFVCMAA